MECPQQIGSLVLAGSVSYSFIHSFNHKKKDDPPKYKNKPGLLLY